MRVTRPKIYFNQLSLLTAILILKNRFLGRRLKKFKGNSLEIAKQILNNNAGKNFLRSGEGHFRLAMWTVDSALAIRGGLELLGRDKWLQWVEMMVDGSLRKNYVPTCFTSSNSYDIPFQRVDNLPTLIYMCDELGILPDKRHELGNLLRIYESQFLNNSLIDMQNAGDWKDTVHRPSSAWANLWVLIMLTLSEKYRLGNKITVRQFRSNIESKLWLKAGGFKDYLGSEKLGIDASVLALYLELFPEKHKVIVEILESENVHQPYPMQAHGSDYAVSAPDYVPSLTRLTAKNYHGTTIWPHLGMMYGVGLAKYGRWDLAKKYREKLKKLIATYQTVPEVLNSQGKPYVDVIPAEFGFTTGAGLYIELNDLIQNNRGYNRGYKT